ncbi:MAG: enoyl-CoA hydratase/isomerase family protein [Brevundimonas sp.]|nr:MAG: enoyl-CoA hydratase/isomerase family protein [Brevundimonas sp.]
MSIDYSVDAGVAVISINRPERKNAITLVMRTEIERAFQAAADDHDVRVIILRGAGSDFSAGADVSEMGGGGLRNSLLRMRHLHRMARSVANVEKPVIAAVQGVCIGMSWALALACDVVIAAENARFQFAFRHIGLAPDGERPGCSTSICRRSAKEIIYSGRFVSGTEAQSLGLALEATERRGPGQGFGAGSELCDRTDSGSGYGQATVQGCTGPDLRSGARL